MEQKISVVVLGLCGAFAIGLSVYRLQASVAAPFLVNEQQILATKSLVGSSPEQDVAKQKRTDTDGDGLSDYDEINVFHTNPNLRDTCGDGIPDNIRVITGKDLNCTDQSPNTGGFMDLSQVTTASASTSQTVPTQGFDFSGLLQAANNETAAQVPAIQQAATPANAGQPLQRDPTAIRAALKGSVDQATLDAMSDDQILQAYDQAMAQYDQQTATGGTTQ